MRKSLLTGTTCLSGLQDGTQTTLPINMRPMQKRTEPTKGTLQEKDPSANRGYCGQNALPGKHVRFSSLLTCGQTKVNKANHRRNQHVLVTAAVFWGSRWDERGPSKKKWNPQNTHSGKNLTYRGPPTKNWNPTRSPPKQRCNPNRNPPTNNRRITIESQLKQLSKTAWNLTRNLSNKTMEPQQVAHSRKLSSANVVSFAQRALCYSSSSKIAASTRTSTLWTTAASGICGTSMYKRSIWHALWQPQPQSQLLHTSVVCEVHCLDVVHAIGDKNGKLSNLA